MKISCLVFLILAGSSLLSAQEFEEIILRSPDPGENDFFGSEMLIYEDFLIVSASGDNTGGEDRGSVYVFTQDDDSTWVLHQKIQASDAANNSWFGTGVAIDGNTFVVGAGDDRPEGIRTGSAYIFESVENPWEEIDKIYPLDGSTGDNFGTSVAVDNNYIVVGAPNQSASSGYKGVAYVYHRTDDKVSWIEDAKLTASDAEDFDFFGRCVDIFEDRIIVTAVGDDDAAPEGGSAYIFERMGDVWEETAKLTGSSVTENQWFGASVILEDDYAIIGCSGNFYMSNPGQVYIFRYDSTAGIWSEEQLLMDINDEGNNYFGFSLARYSNYLFVGAIFSVYNSIRSGASHLFVKKDGAWTHSFTFLPSDGQNGYFFGSAVALNNSHFFVGAMQANAPSQFSGAVYVYQENSTGLEDAININSPDDFFLSQNYPNPFNGTTKIRYRLPIAHGNSAATLGIYDVSGKKCLELTSTLGESSFEISSESLASGIYFYYLAWNGRSTHSRKMLVVK